MSADPPTTEGFEHLRSIASKALGDDAYRQRLVSDPTTVLQEQGITVPDGVNVTVHENTADHIHLVLPTGIKGVQQLDPGETGLLSLSQGIVF